MALPILLICYVSKRKNNKKHWKIGIWRHCDVIIGRGKSKLGVGLLCMEMIIVRGVARIFPVGTHSFPSHLFTPPPKKKRSKSFSIHVSFISNRVRKSLNWIQINLFFCLLFLWVSMCERHCLSCESTTFCSSPFASIYVTYYKKQQCVHGFITPTDKNSI